MTRQFTILGHEPDLRAILLQLPGHYFCPQCGIDIRTNPDARLWLAQSVETYYFRCDCGSGMFALDRSQMEDLAWEYHIRIRNTMRSIP